RFLAVLRSRCSTDFHLRRAAWGLAVVADLDPRAVADHDRLVPSIAGAELAHQRQRACSQSAGGTVGQPRGAAAGIARHAIAARALCWRRTVVAGRWFDRLAVYRAGADCRAMAGVDTS